MSSKENQFLWVTYIWTQYYYDPEEYYVLGLYKGSYGD